MKLKFTTEQHAATKFFQSYRKKSFNETDLLCLLENYREDFQKFLQKKILENDSIKIQFSVFVNLQKPLDETKVSYHASSYAKPVITQLDDNDYY